jgi:hypothetical protein
MQPEEEARTAGRKVMVERVQGPADPEILLDIAEWSAEPLSCGEEKAKAIGCWRCDHGTVS